MSGLSWFWEARKEEAWSRMLANLNIEKKRKFSCDDLTRIIGKEEIPKYFRNPQHDIGALFHEKLVVGEIEEAGEMMGRYNRRIRLYQQT